MGYEDFGRFTFHLLKKYENGELNFFNNPEKTFIEILEKQLEELQNNK